MWRTFSTCSVTRMYFSRLISASLDFVSESRAQRKNQLHRLNDPMSKFQSLSVVWKAQQFHMKVQKKNIRGWRQLSMKNETKFQLGENLHCVLRGSVGRLRVLFTNVARNLMLSISYQIWFVMFIILRWVDLMTQQNNFGLFLCRSTLISGILIVGSLLIAPNLY